MKSLYQLLVVICTCAVLSACSTGGTGVPSSVTLETLEDSVVYALGMDVARVFQQQNVENVDYGILAKGVHDILEKTGEEVFSASQIPAIMNKYMQEKTAASAGANLAKGIEFLKKNKERAEVTETASGLQYEVIQQGSGPNAKLSDKVRVHYEGKLINGEVFDSSIQRGQPIDFPLGGVIQGWQEGLQLMNAGSKYKLYIPGDIAYGERGSPPKIGANETLIFDVELIAINPEPMLPPGHSKGDGHNH